MSIFDKIEDLFKHRDVDKAPSSWLLHRFLASDQDFALVAKKAAQDIRDDEMCFAFWQAIVPKGGKPYLPYVAPKKQSAPPDLIARLMEVQACSRTEAEDMVEIYTLAGMTQEITRELGIELEDDDERTA